MENEPNPPTDARKEATERLLHSIGVPINPWLPLVEDEADARLQSADEVARRAIVLFSLAAIGHGYDSKSYLEMLEAPSLRKTLSPKEREFLADKNPSDSASIQMTWCVEGAWTLIWALGELPELRLPTEQCDAQDLQRIMPGSHRLREFISAATLRSTGEILDETDKIYRLHWAARDASLNDRAVPAGLQIGVIEERHRALNWLTFYADEWDEITTDT